MAYTADDFVSGVRRRAQLPAASIDGKISDADILALADEEMGSTMLPLILAANEEYYVTSSDTAIVANQTEYRIPTRAVGGAIRDLTFVDANGNESSLPEISLEDQGDYARSGGGAFSRQSAYALRGDRVRLLPVPTASSGSLRFYYHWRPGRLVLTTSSQVTDITGISGSTYTVTATPVSWTTSTEFDLIQAKPNFDLLLDNTAPSAVDSGGTNLVFASAITDAAIGDYFAETGVSPIVQIPAELQPAFTSAVVVRVLMSLGDYEAASLEEAKLASQKENAQILIDPRNKGASKRVVNRYSIMRSGGRYIGGW
jgi:hypothetical protein